MNGKHMNLAKSPWLRTLGGREVSLQDALQDAPRIKGLEGATAMMVAAQYRTLLAVLHRALDGPRSPYQWWEIWEQGEFPLAVEEYLHEWRGRFELYGEPGQPGFMQADPPIPGVRERNVNKMVMHARAGGNVCLFGDGRDRTLTPAQAARNLVTIQAFSLGGGSSGLPGRNFIDGPCARGMVFFLVGRNLFETLMFNLLPYPATGAREESGSMESDCPAWERGDIFDRDPLSEKRKKHLPRGITDLYTWPSRRIVLIPDEGSLATSTMQFSCGLRLADDYRDPLQGEALRMRCEKEERENRDATTVFDVVEAAVLDKPIEAISWVNELQQAVGLRLQPQWLLACGQASRLGAALAEATWRVPYPATEEERERVREALEATQAAEGKLWAALGQATVVRRDGIASRNVDLGNVVLVRWRSQFRRRLQDAYASVLNGADVDDYLEQVIQAANTIYRHRTTCPVARACGESVLRGGLSKIERGDD